MSESHTLVVGGTGGIGSRFVERRSQREGPTSVISRQRPDESSAIPGVDYHACDVTESEILATTLDAIVKRHGFPNHIVFFQRYRGQDNSWKGSWETSLTGTRETIENLVPDFPDDETASVVLVGSTAADFVAADQDPGYHVAQAGLVQLTRVYASRLGDRGVRVNCVSPGAVLKDEAEVYYEENEDLKALYEDVTPLGRMGDPTDISQAIEFLLSPRARFITGQNLVVDGGITLNWQASVARQITERASNRTERADDS